MTESTLSAKTEATTAPASGEDGQHAHYPEHSYPYVAHHFDKPEQQFESGKLGIWLFLVTEVLFFSGLFCAYAIYRAIHPEIFVWSHYFLDTKLGAINTGILILSSLTAAWAVRSAQLRQTKLLIINIVVTIVCAFGFMGVKYVEYTHKFHDGLLPGKAFDPKQMVWQTPAFKEKHPESAAVAKQLYAETNGLDEDPSLKLPEKGVAMRQALQPLEAAGVIGKNAVDEPPSRPRNAHIFFGIYFFMTGLHGIHVLIGIGVWIWLLVRAIKGQFGPKYYGPIDFAALYWHLVDLIWIFLFPLLYLIH